jgi:prepilin-type N-terminal cleavage/methylation domain-containing protein
MKRWWGNARGMTLVEVMVTIFILSLITTSMTTVFLTIVRANWKAGNTIQAQQNARLGLDKLTRDLRQARRLMFTGTYGGVTFTTSCSAYPQISFVLPHVASVTLSDGTTTVWAPDPKASDGTTPFDGWYVSYYLAGASPIVQGGSTAPTQTSAGPYLVRAVWGDLAGSPVMKAATMALNITGLVLSDSGTGVCPASSPVPREIVVTLTATQILAGQNVSTNTITQDVTLRNIGGPP